MPIEPRAHPWVAYVVPFSFPWGQAGSRRVEGVSRSIAATGRDVVVVALPSGDGPPDTRARVVLTDPCGATVSTVDRPRLPPDALRRQWAHHVVGASDALEVLDGLSASLPSHLIMYGTSATSLAQALRWGRRRGVPVLVDVVERYAPRQFSGGRFAPGYLSASVGFAAMAARAQGVIAISRHLESHFVGRGVPTLRVPPTLDVQAVTPGTGGDDLAFGYFGSPGRKDLVDVVVDAFTETRRRTGRTDLRLVVGGPGTREALAPRNVPGVDLLGRIPQEEVAGVVGTLTATVLARPAERYADAGYPTKVVESLAVGTPVVCNLTGDLDEVVREGETGFVADAPTVESVAAALIRAVATPAAQLAQMRRSARRTALAHYDSSSHVDPLDRLLRRTG